VAVPDSLNFSLIEENQRSSALSCCQSYFHFNGIPNQAVDSFPDINSLNVGYDNWVFGSLPGGVHFSKKLI